MVLRACNTLYLTNVLVAQVQELLVTVVAVDAVAFVFAVVTGSLFLSLGHCFSRCAVAAAVVAVATAITTFIFKFRYLSLHSDSYF